MNKVAVGVIFGCKACFWYKDVAVHYIVSILYIDRLVCRTGIIIDPVFTPEKDF